VQAVIGALNRALAHMPRVWYSQAWPTSDAETAGSDPLVQWQAYDGVTNARSYRVRILAVPRTAGAGDCYAARSGGLATQATDLRNYSKVAVDEFEDLIVAEFTVARGAVTSAVITEGLSTFNGYTILGIVVQDDDLVTLDTSIHDAVDPGLAKTGGKVLADVLSDCRTAFHALRRYNLPYCTQWAGYRVGGAFQTPVGTNPSAIVVASATQVNVIDQTVVARSATSPGVSCHVQYMGWGEEDETAGQRIKVECRVLAQCTGGAGANGIVRFEGPLNSVDVTVTHGAATAWYTSAPNYLYLDSTVADTDATAARNKIDIFGLIPGIAGEILYIYGLPSWQVAP
jgi:hypothetical protein